MVKRYVLVKDCNNEEVITLANEMIKSCEKCISIEQNMMNNYEN